MVEVDALNMWSRYQQFYDFCQEPIRSVLNICTASAKVQVELTEILKACLKEHVSRPNPMPNFCEPDFRI